MFSRLFNGNSRKFAGVDFMALIPAAKVQHATDSTSQKVTLLVPRYSDPLFGRFIQPYLGEKKKFIRLTLDQRGSWIWCQMDGQSTVAHMVCSFEKEFPNDLTDVPERLSGYLYSMWENKFVVLSNLD